MCQPPPTVSARKRAWRGPLRGPRQAVEIDWLSYSSGTSVGVERVSVCFLKKAGMVIRQKM
jgi:hypothetical protein